MRSHHVHGFRGNTKMLAMARSLGIPLEQTGDALRTAEVQHIHWERWNAENKDAIDHYNARIAAEGLPLEQYRTF